MRIAIVTAALLLGLHPPVMAQGEPPTSLMLVVASDSQLHNVSSRDLYRLFGERRLDAPDGERLIPINLHPKNPARRLFDRRVLGLTPSQVGRHWVNRRIRGESGPPRAFVSEATVLRFVASLPMVVAYVPTGPLPSGLRIVAIDGLTPGDPGYLLEDAP